MTNTVDDQNFSGSVISNCYLVSISGEISNYQMENISNDIIYMVHKAEVCGVIIDLSNLSMLDTLTFDVLKKISKTVSLLGVKVVWLGIKPALASSLVDFDANVDDICIALNLEHGLNIINSKKKCN